MEEKGLFPAIVSRRSLAAEGPLPGHRAALRAPPPPAAGSAEAVVPFSSMSQFSLLQIDVDVEEPETSENPTRPFEIHNIVWRLTQLWP